MSREIKELCERFSIQDFVKGYNMSLLVLTEKRSIISMPVYESMWTSVGIANGMTLGPVANGAGVFLAMANCKYFTPLVECRSFKIFRPTKRNEDKVLFAEASIISRGVKEFRSLGEQAIIIISVSVRGEDEKEKARGCFEYILPDYDIYANLK